MRCEVKGCKSYYKSTQSTNIKYFVFPQNKDLREKWIQACGKKPKNSKRIFICAYHFTDDDWRLQDRLLNVSINKRRLKSDAIPTKNLPKIEGPPSARMERAHTKARKRIVEEAFQSCANLNRQEIQIHEELLIKHEPIEYEHGEHEYEYGQHEYGQYEHEQHEYGQYECEEHNKPEIKLENPTRIVFGTATQTEIDFKCSNQLKIMHLERQNRELKRQNRKLHNENMKHLRVIDNLKKVHSLKNVNNLKIFDNLKKVFTEGQIKKLQTPEKGIKWSVNDICSAICLHSEGPKAYKYLRRKNFPLPAPATLGRWTANIKMKPGILSTVMNLMEHATIVGNDRLCTLAFGEMRIRHKFDYDKASDSIITPSNYVQVVLARGLIKEWKQPVFYEYNCQMSTTILNDIIAKLYEKAYVVVAITSDIEPKNQKLWKELNITKENVWFPHPSNPSNKIFVLADVGYMIKLLRYHFLDSGLILRNAKINADPIKEVLAATSGLKIAHKISDINLNVRTNSKQKYAAQLFSSSVSNAIKQCITTGKCKSEYALQVEDFINIVNKWFDIFNMADSRDSITEFELIFAEQKLIIENMSDIILNMRVIGHKSLLPFQEGMLISNAALLELHNYIIGKYSLNCVLSYRLNQDTIKNFVSTIRGNDGLQGDPSPIEFKNKLKSYIYGICYNIEIFDYKHSNNGNEDLSLKQFDCTDFVEETLEFLGI